MPGEIRLGLQLPDQSATAGNSMQGWLVSNPLEFEPVTDMLRLPGASNCGGCRGCGHTKAFKSTVLAVDVASLAQPNTTTQTVRLKVRTAGLNRCCGVIFVLPVLLLVLSAFSPTTFILAAFTLVSVGLAWRLCITQGMTQGKTQRKTQQAPWTKIILPLRRWIDRELLLSVVPRR